MVAFIFRWEWPKHIPVSLSKGRSATGDPFLPPILTLRTDLKRCRADRGRGDVAIVTLASRAKNGVGAINTGGIADSTLQDIAYVYVGRTPMLR
jgi:hypothetical protein